MLHKAQVGWLLYCSYIALGSLSCEMKSVYGEADALQVRTLMIALCKTGVLNTFLIKSG